MKRILVVDDNEASLALVKSILTHSGYDVTEARNGVEALDQAMRMRPDVVVSDVLMPVMDGFALCREMKKDDRVKEIPLVFYTATYTDPRDEQLAMDLGASRFLIKPMDPAALVTVLNDVLNEKEKGFVSTPASSVEEESAYYRLYNVALIRKLEDKMVELEKVNGLLEQDISALRSAESELRQSEERYRTAIENSNDGVSIIKDSAHIYVNQRFLDMFGYSAPQEIMGREPYFNIHPDDGPMVRGYAERRSGGESVPNQYEFRGIKKDGSVVHVEVSVNTIPFMGGKAILAYLRDVTNRKETEEELRRSVESLRASMETTVQVLALAVEARDPYTAGHQRRTTNLACAIAEAMALPDKQKEGLRMAGPIHDIGKISIPAEILSKPGRLSPVEYALVQSHPENGANILRDIVSPWPLSDIVWQHHERIDGSWYPRGLSGNDTMIEARILAVADVVEAMASHRPYRPALGIEMALEEVRKNRNTLYDGEIVDVCLKLFAEKHFVFE